MVSITEKVRITKKTKLGSKVSIYAVSRGGGVRAGWRPPLVLKYTCDVRVLFKLYILLKNEQ